MQSLTRCISGSLSLSPDGEGARGHPSVGPGGAGSAGGPGGSGGPRGHRPRGTSGSSKKVKFGGDGKLVSYPPSFSGVISWS